MALPEDDGNDSESVELSTTGNADPTLVKIETVGLPVVLNLTVGDGDPATEGLAANTGEMLKEPSMICT